MRVKKTPLPVAASGVAGHDSKALLGLIEAENDMAANDRLQEDTNEAKNALESYIYDLRNKLYEGLGPYVQEVSDPAHAALLSKVLPALPTRAHSLCTSIVNGMPCRDQSA